MWLYFKAMREADKWFEANKEDGDYYTAEFAIGYALTHHPLFMVEMVLEAIVLVAVINFFGK